MTPAQREALQRAAASTEPVRVPAATARILSERYGYIEYDGICAWTLTPKGRAYLAGERADRKRREAENQLQSADRKWASRVVAWLEAHKRFREHDYALWMYARHFAACTHAGVEPVLAGAWPDGTREWVEHTVRSAVAVLKDFDEACATAKARGVGISVSYEADEKVPRSRREAADAAAESASVVSLRTYRERRPSSPRGAA